MIFQAFRRTAHTTIISACPLACPNWAPFPLLACPVHDPRQCATSSSLLTGPPLSASAVSLYCNHLIGMLPPLLLPVVAVPSDAAALHATAL